MTTNTTSYQCLNCERSETQIPLVSLRYNGEQGWICSQCLPLLIHQPERLAGKLANAENLQAADHNH
ncbi:MAG: hypothetical protein GY759_08675 [Chloroflexi bacterium]|nr:hypothetical protein [Chloroflexota bacterium]